MRYIDICFAGVLLIFGAGHSGGTPLAKTEFERKIDSLERIGHEYRAIKDTAIKLQIRYDAKAK